MGGRVDLAEPLHRDQGVDLRGRDRRVAKQFLDDADVGPAVEHVRGERVPQRMGRHVVQAGPLGGGAQYAPGALPGQAPASRVQEYRRAHRDPPGRGGQQGPGPDQVGLEGPDRVATDRDHPLLAALPGQPDHWVVVQAELVHIEPGRLGDPRPGRVQELQQGAVP